MLLVKSDFSSPASSSCQLAPMLTESSGCCPEVSTSEYLVCSQTSLSVSRLFFPGGCHSRIASPTSRLFLRRLPSVFALLSPNNSLEPQAFRGDDFVALSLVRGTAPGHPTTRTERSQAASYSLERGAVLGEGEVSSGDTAGIGRTNKSSSRCQLSVEDACAALALYWNANMKEDMEQPTF